MIARFRSSRKSLSVIRAPAFRLAVSIVLIETSKHIGMLNRLPSAMRTFSTTLVFVSRRSLLSGTPCNLRIVVLLVKET